MKLLPRFLFLSLLLALPGCASISRGVTEAILEHKEEDRRKCEIAGVPFTGVKQSLEAQQPGVPGHTTKVLMVHGVSEHLPGYSTRLRERLARALGLDTVEGTTKEITLYDPVGQRQGLAILRITRHLTADRAKQLLFYELTWSPITEPDKKAIAYDSSEAHSFRRAGLNATLKEFVNGTVPDLLVYMGDRQKTISAAVAQSVCWMFKGDWEQLPAKSIEECVPGSTPMAETIQEDDFFFITHSLGSRITIDTIQSLGTMFKTAPNQAEIQRMEAELRHKDMTVFMLANQLPLLQLGRKPPKVVGAQKQYCPVNAPQASERFLGRLSIVAFSDPNDILSYPIPGDYADRYIDSRICPEVMNVNINITNVKDVFDTLSFADPMTAHSGYHDDRRVIGLIAEGLSRQHAAPIVQKRCEWVEVLP